MEAVKQGTKEEMDLIIRRLRDRMGPEKVKNDELVLVTYASDISPVPPLRPSCVVFPEIRDDVVAVLQTANEYRIPITVMSGGVPEDWAIISRTFRRERPSGASKNF